MNNLLNAEFKKIQENIMEKHQRDLKLLERETIKKYNLVVEKLFGDWYFERYCEEGDLSFGCEKVYTYINEYNITLDEINIITELLKDKNFKLAYGYAYDMYLLDGIFHFYSLCRDYQKLNNLIQFLLKLDLTDYNGEEVGDELKKIALFMRKYGNDCLRQFDGQEFEEIIKNIEKGMGFKKK